MAFARKVWKLLVAIKDGLALAFLLLFFITLYGVLSARPNVASVRDGALLLRLDGSVVEEPELIDPLQTLLSSELPTHQYRARDLVRAIRGAAKDSHIKAVVLDLSRFTGGGQVHMQEIGEALDAVKAAKKPVLAYALAYTDDGYLLASHATEVWVDPMGGTFIAGPGGYTIYYRQLLDRLKINYHVYRVGTYKDYVEPYLRNDQSEEARAARKALLDALWEGWQADVARARPKANIKLVTTDPVGWLKASNGDSAAAARAAGLVDRIGTHTEFGDRVAQIAGKDELSQLPGAFAHNRVSTWLSANPESQAGKAIGVVTIAGEIVDGKAGPGSAGGDRIARLLDEALAKDLAGLVIRVDSPGGSVLASEVIRGAVLRHKAKGIPIAVSMANLAASGGYWVSTPAQRIFAEPGTITGSIGIFAAVPSFEKALAGYGVTGDGVRTTPLSGQPDILTGITPEVDAMIQAGIENGYARFIGLVGKARGKTPEQVDAIAQGRVWDGGTARQNGLVDQFGGLDDALAWVAKQAKLEDGKWHATYLGADANPYASLFERFRSDDESDAPAAADLAGIVALRQQDHVARALAEIERMLGARGAQALCIDCPVIAAKPARAKSQGGWLALAAQFFAPMRD